MSARDLLQPRDWLTGGDVVAVDPVEPTYVFRPSRLSVLSRLAALERHEAVLDIVRGERTAFHRSFVIQNRLVDGNAQRRLCDREGGGDLGIEALKNILSLAAGFAEARGARRPLHGLPAPRLQIQPFWALAATVARVEFAAVDVAPGVNDHRSMLRFKNQLGDWNWFFDRVRVTSFGHGSILQQPCKV